MSLSVGQYAHLLSHLFQVRTKCFEIQTRNQDEGGGGGSGSDVCVCVSVWSDPKKTVY